MVVEEKLRRLELEAKEAAERATCAEAEIDVARHEVAMARLEIDEVGNARVQMESELGRVQCALATFEDARRKVESELDVAQQALATCGEACRTAEEEASRLTDELSKMNYPHFARRPIKRRRPLRQNMRLALKPFSTTDMVVVPLRPIFAEVSLRSQTGCRARQSH